MAFEIWIYQFWRSKFVAQKKNGQRTTIDRETGQPM